MVNETHFGVRSRTLDGFYFVGRSVKIESKAPRGGVAIYKNLRLDVDIDILSLVFRDCVVFKIRYTTVIFAAMYIPPRNSAYYDDSYFKNCELLMDYYKDKNLIIAGDLNSRIGTIPNHSVNPDPVINQNGTTLRGILESNPTFTVVNGLEIGQFDSKFTFYRGKVRSQVDLTITNTVKCVKSLEICHKNIYSDHCPMMLSCTLEFIPSIPMIRECSANMFLYDHYDVNRRIRKPLNLSRIDTAKLLPSLIQLAEDLQDETRNNDVDNLCALITNGIYNKCVDSYKKNVMSVDAVRKDRYPNCNSRHFKAMADINLSVYNMHSDRNDGSESYLPYLHEWKKFEELAAAAESDEMNINCNKSWKDVKKDGKKMWSLIDWKGKNELCKDDKVNESEVNKYFKGIFQSEQIADNPIIDDVIPHLDHHNIYIPLLDDTPDMTELSLAMKSIRRGVSFDGLPPKILPLIPYPLKVTILAFIQNIFFSSYPKDWRLQMLHAITKPGHTYNNPQLRGIAIAPLLSRIYDTILDNRFQQWYTPNREQFGFRPKQGCLLPIFMLLTLIRFCKEKGKDIFVAFLDYAKAFDYVNRAGLLEKLMSEGAGKTYITAIANTYRETFYAPKVNSSQLGTYITSKHGVTQGKRSSANLFSFFVSDMGTNINRIGNDFFGLLSLIQLADDTMLIAESSQLLRRKLVAILDYSNRKYQIPNFKKTKYADFSSKTTTTPIEIEGYKPFLSIDCNKGHSYLGMLFLPTSDVDAILLFNIKSRMKHIPKFYSWLEINENTPFETKLLVIDNCCLSAITYGCESWGDFSCVHQKLISLEIKILKTTLKVKKGTSNDLIFYELRRCNIIAKIKDKQYNFFRKLQELSEDTSIMSHMLQLCNNSETIEYYKSLRGNNANNFRQELEQKIRTDTSSMISYYRNLVDPEKSCIYNSFANDYHRFIITRWRLSNHKLRIETGRYVRPFVPRDERVCLRCGILEDEHHALFVCPRYNAIRLTFGDYLATCDTIKKVLNPGHQSIAQTAALLHGIEDLMSMEE